MVGLGDEGHLRASGLDETVRLGVIAWAQHLTEAERPPGESSPWPASFSLAAALAGSGGTGMSAGQAARSVAEGVCEANRQLTAAGWPVAACLSLVELYLDRASEAWRALQLIVQACPGRFVLKPYIRSSPGALLRPLDSNYRGANFDLITATTQVDARGASSIVYTLDTRRARTEVRAVAAQGRLLRELVSVASSSSCNDDSIGRTLFKLLVPVEVRPFLASATEMQIELDPGTAGIPWEMLDSGRDAGAGENVDYKPWAIRAKLLRKLRTQEFRRQVEDAGRRAPILVIGDPCADDRRYPLLPGARREARAVSALLSKRLGMDRQVKILAAANDVDRGPDSRQVVATLLDGDWGIVHIAGHGQAATDSDDPAADSGAARTGGIVLSNDTFLGPEEFARMERVPDLVFINCCHLAKTDTANLLGSCATPSFHRPDFAASVAEALIKLGVRCVVAAGWAVDDAAAEIFATTFYRALLDGQRFLDAVGTAREAAYKVPGNTWAAYQCYGDPDWCLPGWLDIGCRGGTRAAGQSPEEERQRFAMAYGGIGSPQGLLLALDMIQMELRVSSPDVEESARRLRYLLDTFGDPERNWTRMGAVAEAFATAWREAGLLEEAAVWYQAAFNAADGKASLQSAEQLANVQVRLAWQRLRAAAGANAGVPQPATDASRELLLATMEQLAQLLALHRSMERLALCGSASKRLAMVERVAGRRDAEVTAIGETVRWYQEAEALARAQGARNAYYPAINRCAAELVAHWTAGKEGSYEADWEGLATASPERNNAEPDFWSRSALSEMWIYQCAARGNLAHDLPCILADLGKLHRSLPAINNWRTVRDQADFVLPVYARQADTAERTAAESLLQRLERWAGTAPAVTG
ncbi:CHAT domain-containing protein [Cupriavidus sp. TA19]|uniref:CHAT domain-containing protein n=1 Tax=Cupriavidus sp. TA19 TaxID=701108 RepID=UPI00295F1737|nr:CHAT domain-containing protein [Cupriavidus sp. TA19]